ncbi:hypothetical protein INR49_024948 [Caranx melampygus]|nr:hypothetical protein INR49_024948 [Caranx melampygus]
MREKKDSDRGRRRKETQREKSERELLLGTCGKLWTYSISDLRVDNLSKEGRALTVTNNYFWQPFHSQTYCPGSGQLLYGSIKLGQLRREIHIKLQARSAQAWHFRGHVKTPVPAPQGCVESSSRAIRTEQLTASTNTLCRMQIEEAPLCTDGDPMPGSACGGEGREGGEERRVLIKVSSSASTVRRAGAGRPGRARRAALRLPLRLQLLRVAVLPLNLSRKKVD